MAPLVAGKQTLAPLIAHNMRPRFHPVAKLKHWSRKLKPSAAKPAPQPVQSGPESINTKTS